MTLGCKQHIRGSCHRESYCIFQILCGQSYIKLPGKRNKYAQGIEVGISSGKFEGIKVFHLICTCVAIGDTASPQTQGDTTHPNTRASLVCPCPFSPTPLTSHSGSCAVCCDGALGYTTSPSGMPCGEHHLLYLVVLGILRSLERSRNIRDRSI